VVPGQRREIVASYDRPHASTANCMTYCVSSVSGCHPGCSCITVPCHAQPARLCAGRLTARELTLMFRSLIGRCHGSQLLDPNSQQCHDHFHLSHWHSKVVWRIALTIRALTAAMISVCIAYRNLVTYRLV